MAVICSHNFNFLQHCWDQAQHVCMVYVALRSPSPCGLCPLDRPMLADESRTQLPRDGICEGGRSPDPPHGSPGLAQGLSVLQTGLAWLVPAAHQGLALSKAFTATRTFCFMPHQPRQPLRDFLRGLSVSAVHSGFLPPSFPHPELWPAVHRDPSNYRDFSFLEDSGGLAVTMFPCRTCICISRGKKAEKLYNTVSSPGGGTLEHFHFLIVFFCAL